MSKGLIIILIVLLSVSCNSMKEISVLPKASKQMMLVITESATSTKGVMYLFERNDGNWAIIPGNIPVCVGKNGLAWGKGLHKELAINGFPIKKEGDGKSPAGIYSLGAVFGYASADEMKGLKMPYIPVSQMTECVDDENSAYYNQIVAKDETDKKGKFDWKSSEKMRLMGEVYDIGATVEHNMHPVNNGGGSCIFLHIWSGPDSYTAGCTSMSPENMKKLAFWMDKAKSPVLAQLTKPLYMELKQKFGLPEYEK
jgi:D-alanyl-D-alanine dipeptidase